MCERERQRQRERERERQRETEREGEGGSNNITTLYLEYFSGNSPSTLERALNEQDLRKNENSCRKKNTMKGFQPQEILNQSLS